MKTMTFKIRVFLAFILFAGLLLHKELRAQEFLWSDSALNVFSVEDLVKLRKELAKEREDLLNRQDNIRDRGLEVTEEFLGKTKEENSNQDKILIRVAEYYIEEEDLDFERRYDRYEQEYTEYEKQLQAFESGKLTVMPVEPVQPLRNYQKAISIYDLIIRNFPESDLVDDAFYNKAYLFQEMDESIAARQIFQTIIDEYPESRYAPEAYMNLAESFFYPEPEDDKEETILKLNKAIQLYQNVLQYKDSPRYDEALYKLGWSYYRLAGENPEHYTDAVTHFVAVVEDIDRLKELDPTGEIIRTDVKPEALQFVAASFIDPAYSQSGVANAKEFVEKMGKPSFGIDIMESMGDRYGKITQWDDAIIAYNELIDMYPEYIYAPRVQKKIADAYIADEQFDRAFEERKFLFQKYNPKSEWYAQLEQRNIPDRITALDEAYRITEEAFRTNITYLYNVAQQKENNNENATGDYEQFVSLCRSYLENFPTDENAYEINWALAYVLDTKLSRFEESFTEYIRVSNDYLETGHQFDAAINAINVADTLVKITRAVENPMQIGGDRLATRQIRDLSSEEGMLAEAYDNFIKLFPDSPQTPSVLAAAGALYYNHRKYDLARKYYKTMVTKFPKSQEKSVGLVSLMNSYFFLGQYRDAEIVAKKILNTPDIPEDQLQIATSRVGESIYKNGERLEQEGYHLEAAKEYFRVYEEAVDYVDFVDLALFKSARNFEQAGEWKRAIETYEILVTNYRQSKQVLPALNNIAADYKELEDYYNVAKTNERVFETFSGSPEAENALFNASLFYAKAEAWQEGIRTNNLYIQTYPTNPESKDLLFENARYYLKLDDLANANRIYQEFANLYPNDPLTIEAFYNRGVYYYDRGEFETAKVEFNKAIQRSSEFARAGRDPNLYYAAEANYKLGQILYHEYKAIQLSYPQSALRAQLERKQAMLKDVQESFTRVIALGSVRSFEAMYRIAEAYEEFANAVANQQLPENLSKDEKLVQQDQVFRAAVPAYDRAVEEYKNVLINLPLLAEKLDISLDSTRTQPEITESVPQDSGVVVQKEVEVDSSREVAIKWYGRAKEKISLIQYSVAERSSDFVTEYLRVENPNQGIRALVFKDQVLRTLVAPQVNTTIEAHLKNIAVADELNLDNKYVEESKRKVLLARNVLANEYEKLVYETANIYLGSIPALENLIEQGEGATTSDGMDYYDYQDNYVMQLIFYMNQFSKIALNQYKATLQIAGENNIDNDARLTTEQKMFNFGYEAGVKMKQIARTAAQKSEDYLNRFDETQNANFQLASTFFDDQNFELIGYSQEIYQFAYDMSKETGIENIWTQMILAKLIELDPATYLADLPKEEFVVSSKADWLATTRLEQNWNSRGFVDSQWKNVVTLNLPYSMTFKGFDSLQVSPSAIWAADSAYLIADPADSALLDTVQNTLVNTSDEPDTLTAYFRKKFTLASKSIEGWIAIAGDQSYHLYINDIYITGMDKTEYEKVEVLPFETFSNFLQTGENLLAVSVTDYDGPPQNGLKFYMHLTLLPGDLSDTINNIRSKMGDENIDPETLEKNGVLNKNRIID
jgi:tetratricopeptide (TPR) repeat protein